MQLKWPMLWDLFSLFPAHAGVILQFTPLGYRYRTFPRTRGGDPYPRNLLSVKCDFSPHTRGWFSLCE